MLTELFLENFKCFSKHTIPLRSTTIIVGKNNAGKSTIIEALRLISLVSNRVENLSFREVPRWLDIPKVNSGVSPSLDNQNFDFANVFHRYGDPPAKIKASFESGAEITVYIGGEDRVYAVTKDAKRRVIASKAHARNIALPKIGLLLQVGPLLSGETVLLPEYILKCISSRLAPQHFRNQLNVLFDDWFAEFVRFSEMTWPGLAIRELRGKGKRHGADLELLVRNDDFVGEVGWMGHGLQMWLQIMWFLARCTDLKPLS